MLVICGFLACRLMRHSVCKAAYRIFSTIFDASEALSGSVRVLRIRQGLAKKQALRNKKCQQI